MGRLWANEHERLTHALTLVREAARLIDGYAPTAESHLGTARVVLQAMISTPAAGQKVERPGRRR